MLPKAKAIEDAIRGGVRRVHVMSYKSPEGILAEVFTNEGAGTLIVADVNALSPAEQQVRQASKTLMSRLWDKGAPLDERVLAYTAGDDYALDERLVKYDVRASIAHAEMLNAQKLLGDADLKAIREGLDAIGAEHAAGQWKIELADEDGQTALEKRLTARIGAAGGRVHLGRSRNDQVLTALRLYLLDAARELAAAAEGCAAALDALAAREGQDSAARLHPHAAGHAEQRGAVGGRLRGRAARRRAGPRRIRAARLAQPAGFGRRLRHARLAARSRAHAREARFRRGAPAGDGGAARARQGRGAVAVRMRAAHAGPWAPGRRPAAVLHAGIRVRHAAGFVHHRLVDHAAEAQSRTCSSWCAAAAPSPKPASPKCSASSPSCPPGYQRDLQLIKPPLFRGIDLALATAGIMAVAIDGVRFRPERIKLDPAIHAAEEANALVAREGIPFREAYRRIGEKYRK